jgi:carbon-monoxide dehydrogenase medium subunit
VKPLNGFSLIRPKTLVGALEALATLEKSQPVAGCTDVIPVQKVIGSRVSHLIDLGLVAELNGIYEDKKHVHIGATTTHSQLFAEKFIAERLQALHEACGIIGSLQIRNRGTLGGNVCNASPAADSATPLIVHGAELNITSLKATRWEPIEAFFTGPKKTILKQDEIVTSFKIPIPSKESGSAFQRIGRRSGFCLSVVNCASFLERDGAKVKDARVAFGSVAPTPLLVKEAGDYLRGKKLTEAVIAEAAEICKDKVKPIDDIRGTAEYRKDMTAVLAKRTLREAWKRSGGKL